MIGRNKVGMDIVANDKTGKGFSSAEKRMRGLAGSAKAIMGTVGAVYVARTLVNVAQSAVDYGSSLTDAAEATRTNMEALQSLRYAARMAGAQEAKLDMALIRVNKSAVDAANGLMTYKRGFDFLNINLDKFVGLSGEEKLEQLAKAMVKSNDQNRAAAAVMDILGSRNAPKLMEVLKRLGHDGFGQLKKDAEDAGQVMGSDTAQNLDELADAVATLKNKMMIKVGNVIGDEADDISSLIDKINSLGDLKAFGISIFEESAFRAISFLVEKGPIIGSEIGGWIAKGIKEAAFGSSQDKAFQKEAREQASEEVTGKRGNFYGFHKTSTSDALDAAYEKKLEAIKLQNLRDAGLEAKLKYGLSGTGADGYFEGVGKRFNERVSGNSLVAVAGLPLPAPAVKPIVPKLVEAQQQNTDATHKLLAALRAERDAKAQETQRILENLKNNRA